MNDPRDYKLDLRSEADGSVAGGNKELMPAAADRPFLSVLFNCCKVYQRIYRDADGRHYHGRCPKCGVQVKFVVGEGGTDSRSFIVS